MDFLNDYVLVSNLKLKLTYFSESSSDTACLMIILIQKLKIVDADVDIKWIFQNKNYPISCFYL